MKTGQGVSLTGFILTSWSGGFMVSALASGSSGPGLSPGAHFSKALETFRARKTILDLSVCNHSEVCTSEHFALKGTFVDIPNM